MADIAFSILNRALRLCSSLLYFSLHFQYQKDALHNLLHALLLAAFDVFDEFRIITKLEIYRQ